MREHAIVRMILKRLKEEPDSYVLNLHASGYGRRGVPDILWVHWDRAIFIEGKTETGRCTRAQEREGAKIRVAGAIWEIIRTKQELEKLIEEVVNDRVRRSNRTRIA